MHLTITSSPLAASYTFFKKGIHAVDGWEALPGSHTTYELQ